MDHSIRFKTLDDWRKQVEHVIHEIHTHAYFVDRWKRVEHKKPLALCSKHELLEPFQHFWELLPDHRSIRVHPFFLVCDLAEEYCFGSEHADPDSRDFDIGGLAHGHP